MRVVIFMLFFAILGNAQNVKQEYDLNGLPLFDMEKVVEVEGSKSELFQRMRKVLIDIYPNDIIEIQDKEDGVMLVKSAISYEQKRKVWGGWELSRGAIKYRVQMMVKDGKYKYRISSFVHSAGKSFGYIHKGENGIKLRGTAKFWREKIWGDLQDNVRILIERVSGEIEREMVKEEIDW